MRFYADVDADDYDSLPDAEFVRMMSDAFPQPKIMTVEENYKLLSDLRRQFKRDAEDG